MHAVIADTPWWQTLVTTLAGALVGAVASVGATLVTQRGAANREARQEERRIRDQTATRLRAAYGSVLVAVYDVRSAAASLAASYRDDAISEATTIARVQAERQAFYGALDEVSQSGRLLALEYDPRAQDLRDLLPKLARTRIAVMVEGLLGQARRWMESPNASPEDPQATPEEYAEERRAAREEISTVLPSLCDEIEASARKHLEELESPR